MSLPDIVVRFSFKAISAASLVTNSMKYVTHSWTDSTPFFAIFETFLLLNSWLAFWQSLNSSLESEVFYFGLSVSCIILWILAIGSSFSWSVMGFLSSLLES